MTISVTDKNTISCGGGSSTSGGRLGQENPITFPKSNPPATLLSLLTSGPKREANLTSPAARQDFHQPSTVMTDANLDTTANSLSALRSLDNTHGDAGELKVDSPKQVRKATEYSQMETVIL